jgi:Lrp/AsnC family leucine-responsive transcriptional regulator
MGTPSEIRNVPRQTFEPLDALDLRIIEELQADARLRIAELGRRVGLSPPAVAERMRRLEDCAVLTFRAEVNPRALGYTITAIVRVSPLGGHVHAIPEIARQTPEITECYRITGEDCYFMKLHLRTIEDLEPILDRFTAHGRTTTSIVHSAAVLPRPLPAAANLEVGMTS